VSFKDQVTQRIQNPLRPFDPREFCARKIVRGRTEENLAVASAVTAAIAAASSTPVATPSAATAASTAPTTVSAAITASSTTPSTAAFSLRTSFIHYQRAAKKVFAVEGCNRLLRCAVVMNLGETETTRLSGETIAQQRERIRLYADFSKQRLHLLFCCLEREVPNVQFLHGRSPGPCLHGTRSRN
jgi:hypothetical protein